MRCRKCGEKAVIHLHQHRLALCKEHFLKWLPEQTERFIKKYNMFTKSERVLVAVSGGKDSLSLWDVLNQLGYQTEGLYIDLGIDAGISYSTRSRQFAERFANKRKLQLHVIDLMHDYRQSIPQLASGSHRGKSKPCSVCGVVKRYLMNKAALDGGFSTLSTAHNLDDEAAILFMNTLNWSLDLLGRQSPLLSEGYGFARKVKPFCRIYERETAAYAFLKNIKVMSEECPYSVGSTQLYYKNILNQMEDDQPSTKLNFYLGYLRARKEGAFPWKPDGVQTDLDKKCPNCGQLTSLDGLCSFCRLVIKQSH